MTGASAPAYGVAALVTAAGSSTRMGGTVKKEYRPLPGAGPEALSVLGAGLCALADSGAVDLLVVVVPPGGEAEARSALPARLLAENAAPPLFFASGGNSRRRSVHAGLERIAELGGAEWVLIHDGARPWLDRDLIEDLVREARLAGAVIPVMPLVETPKETDAEGFIVRHLRRARVAAAQTPQAFHFPRILAAHGRAALSEENDGVEYTDDAEVWGAFEGPVKTIPGKAANRKITFPEDLAGGPA